MKFLQKLLKFGNLFNDVEIYVLLSLSFKVTKGIILLLSNNYVKVSEGFILLFEKVTKWF